MTFSTGSYSYNINRAEQVINGEGNYQFFIDFADLTLNIETLYESIKDTITTQFSITDSGNTQSFSGYRINSIRKIFAEVEFIQLDLVKEPSNE